MRKLVLAVSCLLLFGGAVLADFDLGDLPPCNYPTFFGNPGHSITGKAWLGPCITTENTPWPVNADPCDDGVNYLNLPWTPCTMVQVTVTVTIGPAYDNNPLWLNGWKDGNLDGDFCDTLCEGAANEWIVQDVLVTPGTHTFTFADPGVLNMGVYDGVFRWRLTGRTIGRMGFGFYNPWDCPDMPFCGNFGADSLGEVEDYWIDDAQLDVALNGGLEIVAGDGELTLHWNTASETDNDHFEVMRDGAIAANVPSQGNDASGHDYAWTDRALVNGTTYTYVLTAVDANGNRQQLATQSASPSASVVTEYALHQNFPNPFNPSTSISFDLPESGHVTMKVFNMVGQQVAILANGSYSSGRHTIDFHAGDLPSGLYLYRIDASGYSVTKKMLLMK